MRKGEVKRGVECGKGKTRGQGKRASSRTTVAECVEDVHGSDLELPDM